MPKANPQKPNRASARPRSTSLLDGIMSAPPLPERERQPPFLDYKAAMTEHYGPRAQWPDEVVGEWDLRFADFLKAESIPIHFDEQQRRRICPGDDCAFCAAGLAPIEELRIIVMEVDDPDMRVYRLDLRPEAVLVLQDQLAQCEGDRDRERLLKFGVFHFVAVCQRKKNSRGQSYRSWDFGRCHIISAEEESDA